MTEKLLHNPGPRRTTVLVAAAVLLLSGCLKEANWTYYGPGPDATDIAVETVGDDGIDEVGTADVPGTDTDVESPVDVFDIDTLIPTDTTDVPDIPPLDVPPEIDPCANACGDGTCATECEETVETCPADCCATACGDGLCQTAECGEIILTCPVDCCLFSCGNGNCDTDPCGEGWWEGLYTCPLDCASCGNGTCDPLEDAENCAQDCCGTCGDLVCKCETPDSCPEDCGQFACGNDICEPGENPVVCLVDCQPFACGNGLCDPGEDPVACPEDCAESCGDCVCDGSEDYTTCPQDCASCGDGTCTICVGMETKENCAWDCCTDDNPCTLDLSKYEGEAWMCYHIPNLVGLCESFFPCTIGDECVYGVCVPGMDPNPCDDGNDCTADGCDEVEGCTHTPLDDDAPCPQGTCQEGVCVCVPACAGKDCGDDGCGGSCGSCANYETCDAFNCICNPDDLEPNDICGDPTPVVTSTTYTAHTLCTGDEDWFLISIPVGATLTATATFSHSLGDLDLYFFPAGDCEISLDSATSTTDDETLTHGPVGEATNVLLQVHMSKTDEGNVYDLSIQLTL